MRPARQEASREARRCGERRGAVNQSECVRVVASGEWGGAARRGEACAYENGASGEWRAAAQCSVYRSHFREIDEEAVVAEGGAALLDEREVREVHAQIWTARQATPMRTRTRIGSGFVSAAAAAAQVAGQARIRPLPAEPDANDYATASASASATALSNYEHSSIGRSAQTTARLRRRTSEHRSRSPQRC